MIAGLLAQRMDGGYKATSSARLLSAMRRFFQHLYREKIRQDDPSALLASPKLPQRLPKDLSEAQVERLLQSPPLTSRWSYAIKRCLKCFMLPAFASRNW
jgi:integrase/recombinase XerD